MDKNKDSKQIMLDKIAKSLEHLGEELRADTQTTTENKLPQMDAIIHTLHFLQEFDENVQVLNEYWLKKNRAIKFKEDNDDMEH